jgi:hypothetical protein
MTAKAKINACFSQAFMWGIESCIFWLLVFCYLLLGCWLLKSCDNLYIKNTAGNGGFMLFTRNILEHGNNL